MVKLANPCTCSAKGRKLKTLSIIRINIHGVVFVGFCPVVGFFFYAILYEKLIHT